MKVNLETDVQKELASPNFSPESRLLGVDSLKLSFEETAEILRQLTPGIESGIFPPPRVETFPLEEGPGLYRDMAESKIKGKPILIP